MPSMICLGAMLMVTAAGFAAVASGFWWLPVGSVVIAAAVMFGAIAREELRRHTVVILTPEQQDAMDEDRALIQELERLRQAYPQDRRHWE